jgi:hypothetical protein
MDKHGELYGATCQCEWESSCCDRHDKERKERLKGVSK